MPSQQNCTLCITSAQLEQAWQCLGGHAKLQPDAQPEPLRNVCCCMQPYKPCMHPAPLLPDVHMAKHGQHVYIAFADGGLAHTARPRLRVTCSTPSRARDSFISCLRGQRLMPWRRHARLRVVAHTPRRLAASFSPTPKWACSSKASPSLGTRPLCCHVPAGPKGAFTARQQRGVCISSQSAIEACNMKGHLKSRHDLSPRALKLSRCLLHSEQCAAK